MVRCSVADPDPGRIRIQSGPLIRIQWARKVEKIRNLKKNFIKKNPFNSRFENFVFKQFLQVWIRIEKKCWIRGFQLIRIRNTGQMDEK